MHQSLEFPMLPRGWNVWIRGVGTCSSSSAGEDNERSNPDHRQRQCKKRTISPQLHLQNRNGTKQLRQKIIRKTIQHDNANSRRLWQCHHYFVFTNTKQRGGGTFSLELPAWLRTRDQEIPYWGVCWRPLRDLLRQVTRGPTEICRLPLQKTHRILLAKDWRRPAFDRTTKNNHLHFCHPRKMAGFWRHLRFAKPTGRNESGAIPTIATESFFWFEIPLMPPTRTGTWIWPILTQKKFNHRWPKNIESSTRLWSDTRFYRCGHLFWTIIGRNVPNTRYLSCSFGTKTWYWIQEMNCSEY